MTEIFQSLSFFNFLTKIIFFPKGMVVFFSLFCQKMKLDFRKMQKRKFLFIPTPCPPGRSIFAHILAQCNTFAGNYFPGIISLFCTGENDQPFRRNAGHTNTFFSSRRLIGGNSLRLSATKIIELLDGTFIRVTTFNLHIRPKGVALGRFNVAPPGVFINLSFEYVVYCSHITKEIQNH